MDKQAVKVIEGVEKVVHLPREFCRIAWYFLGCSGQIIVEVIGRRRHCKHSKQRTNDTLERTT